MYLIDQLVKAKIPKKTATELIDYVEKRKDKSIDRLWVVMIGGFAFLSVFMALGLGWLASEIKDTRQEVKDTRQEVKQEIKDTRQAIEGQIKELKILIKK